MSEVYLELRPTDYSFFNERSGAVGTSPAFGLAPPGARSIDALGLRWNEDLRLVPEDEDVLAEWSGLAAGAIASRGSMDDHIPDKPPEPHEHLSFRRRFVGRGLVTLTSRRLLGLLDHDANVDTNRTELEGVLAFVVPLTEVARLELFRRSGTGWRSGEQGLLISTNRPGRLLLEPTFRSVEEYQSDTRVTRQVMFEAIARAAAEAQLRHATPEASRLLNRVLEGAWEPEPFGFVKRTTWYDNRENLVARLQAHWSEDTTGDKLIRLAASNGVIRADEAE